MNGWNCPKCGYVWAGWVNGCINCNRPEHEKFKWSNGTIIPSKEANLNPKNKEDSDE